MTTDSDMADERQSPLLGSGRPRQLAIGYFGLLCLAIIIAAFASFAMYDYDRSYKEAEQETRSAAFFLADHASRLFEAVELGIREVAGATEGRAWGEIATSADVWKVLSRLTDRFPYAAAIALYDETGQARLATTGPLPDVSVKDRDYFLAPKSGFNTLYISDPTKNRLTGERAFVLSRRIEDAGGHFRGIAAAVADLSYFQKFYGSLNLADAPVITLFRSDRHVLLQYPRSAAGDSLKVLTLAGIEQAIARAPRGSAVEPSGDGKARRLYSFHKISDLPLYVSVALPVSVVVERWWHDIRISAALAIIAIMALAGLTLLAFRQARVGKIITNELERRVQARTSDLKAANNQLEILFQEVHHRVKNNLQIISSFLRLQMARTTNEDQRASLQQGVNRVHAMSLVHEMLYSADEIVQIDFGSYLNSLAHHLNVSFDTSARVAIRVSADGLRLDLDTAIPLALLINEVLSNALKHAFPENRAGTIGIDLRHGEGGMTALTIRDDGIGVAPGFDWYRARGLGFRIVRSLAAKLGGTVNFASVGGMCFTLRFKAPSRPPRPVRSSGSPAGAVAGRPSA